MPQFTKSQQNVIDYRGKNMLVSASAGTGKTTVMIERIAELIAEGADVSQFVVVTFTNLAAAEMKKRLADKLSERRGDRRIAEQLEKLDNASICTIDSFCSELLRNYFYVVDIDPSFSILDSVTVTSLRKNALDEVFKEYFKNGDKLFKKTYSIFASKRREENFKTVLMRLYEFSRCLPDFYPWYRQMRENFLNLQVPDNPVVKTLLTDIKRNVEYFAGAMTSLTERFQEDCLDEFAEACEKNAENLRSVNTDSLQQALDDLGTLKMVALTRKDVCGFSDEELAREDFKQLRAEIDAFKKKYETLSRGERVDKLFGETASSVQYTDKLVEIVQKFEETFFALKKQRGGVDFGDLEHLALQLLRDGETASAVYERYKYVFVDEYQDTNPLQEELISLLSRESNLFVVGDIKQSIYGFRGCEPDIFRNKYDAFEKSDDCCVEDLNENFRSNKEILQFVNDVFGCVMTEDFGKVAYRERANLLGNISTDLKTASVQIDLVVKGERNNAAVEDIYDITAERAERTDATQGEVIADKINRFVGMAYKDKNGAPQRIGYGDIVVLVRSMQDKAVAIYNTLVEHNIPVVANFKLSGYANKEVRDLINLLRALDNPYNDIYTVGACLAPYGGFSEDDLAQIKIATQDERVPFCTRLQIYAENAKNDVIVQKSDVITTKINNLLSLLDELRFYSHSATVDEVVLKVVEKTNFHLYVQGLPNGALRLRKMYAFVDELKGAAYAQSIERFLSFLDDSEEVRKEDGVGSANAVRIMSMHASKGLEFPIVIVAAVETSFVVDHPPVECNNNLGLVTKYYDFDTMRVAGTLGAAACGMFNRTKQQEEEMRLLYVALTRAKLVLNVVGSVKEKQLLTMPKRPSAANSHLDWLLTALKRKYGNLEDAETAELINVVRQTSVRKAECANLMCEQYDDMAAVEEQLAYKYPYESQTKMPSKIVSSALDKEYVDADPDRYEVALADNNDRNFVGTAYHKVYQYVRFGAGKEEIEQAIDGLVKQDKIERQYADKIDVDLIFETLNNEQLKNLMEGGAVYHEMPFMLYVPYNEVADDAFCDEVMLQGVIDLLIISADKTRATVVDFKYSSHAAEFLKESYKKQLKSYRLAVQKICGIQNVDCYILSIAENKLIKV